MRTEGKSVLGRTDLGIACATQRVYVYIFLYVNKPSASVTVFTL